MATARKRVWARLRNTFTVAAAGFTEQDLLVQLETNVGRTLIDTTVVRSIGRLTVQPVGTVVGQVQAAWGVMPFVAGMGTFPNPTTAANFNDDWMYWDSCLYEFESYQTTANTRLEENNVSRSFSWDIRSQRKLRSTQRLTFITGNDGDLSLQFGLTVSTLVLL